MCISCRILNLSLLNDPQFFKKCLSVIPESGYWKVRRKKMQRYYFNEDRIRSLGASLLLFSVLREYGMESADIEVNQYGKPFLCNSDMQFNLSHSENYVVCSYGYGNSGIDIECYKNASVDVAKRFFQHDEYELVEKYGDKMFTRLWTLKESYIKADGRGLNIGLDSFKITLGNAEKNLISSSSFIPAFSTTTYVDSNDKINFVEFIVNDFHVAVCSNKKINDYLIIDDLFQHLSCGLKLSITERGAIVTDVSLPTEGAD